MTNFFKLDRLLSRKDFEKLEKELEEKTGERCVVLPPYLEKISPRVLYVCDRRACDRCSPECSHTSDIAHAANFRKTQFGDFWEGVDDDGAF